jgi:hypothetical protein
MKRTVRTTMRPDQTLEVDEQEYRSMHRQGLLINDTPPPSAPASVAKAAPATPAKKTSGAAGKES